MSELFELVLDHDVQDANQLWAWVGFSCSDQFLAVGSIFSRVVHEKLHVDFFPKVGNNHFVLVFGVPDF